jgi:hypothetical protein
MNVGDLIRMYDDPGLSYNGIVIEHDTNFKFGTGIVTILMNDGEFQTLSASNEWLAVINEKEEYESR